jgi:hypothetical protein
MKKISFQIAIAVGKLTDQHVSFAGALEAARNNWPCALTRFRL